MDFKHAMPEHLNRVTNDLTHQIVFDTALAKLDVSISR